MIKKEDFFLFGKIIKSIGYKGELLLAVIHNLKIKRGDTVFIEIDGKPVPFFIEDIQAPAAYTRVLRLEDVNTEAGAKSLTNLPVFLPKEKHRAHHGSALAGHDVKGYRVVDRDHNLVGEVEELVEMPHQPILKVRNPKGEVLIPVVEEIIIRIDTKQRLIEIDPPEGLIGLNLD